VTAFWQWFWTIWFAIAGLSFAGIALVVALKGVGDLRVMVRLLERQARQEGGGE
jgi:hypothetical protein